MTTAPSERLLPGATAVRRDVFRGKVYSAYPHRVVSDTGATLAIARWPGVTGWGPASWIEALRTGDTTAREQLVPQLARGDWQLGRWTWQHTTCLALLYADRYFSVNLMFAPERSLTCWYVNFELPYTRTGIGVDTCDLQLDLVVDPDLSYRWKDEDEYAHARRLGVITDATHRHVEQAREEAIGLVERRRGPFAESWHRWQADTDWPRPELPTNALDLPAGRR